MLARVRRAKTKKVKTHSPSASLRARVSAAFWAISDASSWLRSRVTCCAAAKPGCSPYCGVFFGGEGGEGKCEGNEARAARAEREAAPPPPPTQLTFSWRVSAAFFPPSTR